MPCDGHACSSRRAPLAARGHGELLTPAIAASAARRRASAPADLDAVVAGTGPRPVHRPAGRAGHRRRARRRRRRPHLRRLLPGRASAAACADEPGLLVATDARRTEVYWAALRVRRARRRARRRPPRRRSRSTALSAVAGAGGELYPDAWPGLRAPPRALPRACRPRPLRARPDRRRRARRTADPAVPAPPRRGRARRAQGGDPVTAPCTIVPMTAAHIDAADALRARHVRHRGVDARAATAPSSPTPGTATTSRPRTGDGAAARLGRRLVVGDTAEILTVGVVPAARRTGLGPRLLAGLLDEARPPRRRARCSWRSASTTRPRCALYVGRGLRRARPAAAATTTPAGSTRRHAPRARDEADHCPRRGDAMTIVMGIETSCDETGVGLRPGRRAARRRARLEHGRARPLRRRRARDRRPRPPAGDGADRARRAGPTPGSPSPTSARSPSPPAPGWPPRCTSASPRPRPTRSRWASRSTACTTWPGTPPPTPSSTARCRTARSRSSSPAATPRCCSCATSSARRSCTCPTPWTTPPARPSTRWPGCIGLPYPGGPSIDRAARERRPGARSASPAR